MAALWTNFLSNPIDILPLAAVTGESMSRFSLCFDLVFHSSVATFIDVPEYNASSLIRKPEIKSVFEVLDFVCKACAT